jgi:hypothetical protein
VQKTVLANVVGQQIDVSIVLYSLAAHIVCRWYQITNGNLVVHGFVSQKLKHGFFKKKNIYS